MKMLQGLQSMENSPRKFLEDEDFCPCHEEVVEDVLRSHETDEPLPDPFGPVQETAE